MSHNTEPEAYVIHLAGRTFFNPAETGTPSDRIVRLLQQTDPRIVKYRFNSAVGAALSKDALVDIYSDDRAKADAILKRAERRFGKTRLRELLRRKSELLGRIGTPLPDAYMIDDQNGTVVCYEIEDTNSLKADVLIRYSNLWSILEYLAWDLHLIAYDIYGHHRIVLPFDAAVMAAAVRRSKRAKSQGRQRRRPLS
jgi:hypothetical protein